MKLDAQLGVHDLALVPAEARRMERLGFDALWTFETNHDPFLPLASAAMATERLQVGTNIAVAFARTPFAMAMVAWDLQRASGGRFLLGLGTQVRMHVERRFSAPWGRPAARVKEAIQCIRAIWETWQNGGKPDFQGEFYQFRLTTPFFDPGPIEHPRIPIYLAGVNPTLCRAAGEVADGFHVHPLHSVRYLREVVRPAIDEGAKTRGKSVADLELYAPVLVVTGRTPEETRAREQFVREQIAFYASTPNYRGVLDLHGWTALGEKLSQMVRAGEWDSLAAQVTDEMLDAFAVTAPPERLPGVLRQRYEGLLGRVSLYFPIPPSDPEPPWRGFVEGFRQAAA
ncbi:MAG: TIGR03617 family F420-dependent LLM class oxidoreductase [SAR324 cluster bacterium]|nr:TIGR03617 family F420-dependent LLM class oxidoreductase [SAR324 cluster bacterium]